MERSVQGGKVIHEIHKVLEEKFISHYNMKNFHDSILLPVLIYECEMWTASARFVKD